MCVLLCLSSVAQALYYGNPQGPTLLQQGLFLSGKGSWWDLKLGFQEDILLDKRLESCCSVRGRIDDFHGYVNQGVIALGVVELIEVYGSLGSMKVKVSHHPKPDHARREYESGDHLAAGFGARAILFQTAQLSLGCDTKFLYAKLPIKWNTLNGVCFPTGADLYINEWQIGVGLAYQTTFFVPYFAVKYSNVHARISQIRANMQLPSDHFKMTNRDHFGLALGCTLTSQKTFDITVEIRVIDEQASSVAANLRL